MPNPETDTLTRLVRIETKTDIQTEVLERLDHAVNGNGKPGLRVEVDRLNGWAKENRWLTRSIALAILAMVLRDTWGKIYPTSSANSSPSQTTGK